MQNFSLFYSIGLLNYGSFIIFAQHDAVVQSKATIIENFVNYGAFGLMSLVLLYAVYYMDKRARADQQTYNERQEEKYQKMEERYFELLKDYNKLRDKK
jgi:low temperature requirement protein LtrA